ncbi:glycosyltransferase [Rothia uropygialis]|uniref:glycosyltransferase n=1 Tax=Kocuria sp. 36 TaxID=1415402 RepID=UPI001EE8176D|nr:glycosyltransferase [Kocuria sp. 36]
MYKIIAQVAHRLTTRSSAGDFPIAIAHDYLTQRGGAERVVLALHKIFPEAPIYTTLYDPEATFPEFKEADVRTSPLNRISFLRRRHRLALPLLPLAATLFRVPAKLTIVSSTGWAHGFNVSGGKVVYCHSPARWLYRRDQYMGDRAAGTLTARVLDLLKPALTRWDQWAATADGHPYIANSTVVQERIRSVYGLEAPIIYPPHNVDANAIRKSIPGIDWGSNEFFLVVSRLLPYKNVQHAIEAVRGTRHRLVVIGAGPMESQLRATAPENVRLTSNLDDAQMRWAYSHCSAVLAVSYEDFGITPLEGAAYGKPTLALRAGGFLDTIKPGVTGQFIDTPEPEAIRRAMDEFSPSDFEPTRIQQHARSFGQSRFERQLRGHLRKFGEDF